VGRASDNQLTPVRPAKAAARYPRDGTQSSTSAYRLNEGCTPSLARRVST
jgi:hypothetical protein